MSMDRFWVKVNKTEGCWQWTAGTGTNGYGRFFFKGTAKTASRVSWELCNGAIPGGLCVLHRCDTPSCVNPDHLFLGTQGDNHRDMMAKGRWQNRFAGKAHCTRGHEYTPQNTYYLKNGRGRSCRQCGRMRAANSRAKRRAA